VIVSKIVKIIIRIRKEGREERRKEGRKYSSFNMIDKVIYSQCQNVLTIHTFSRKIIFILFSKFQKLH
jgi:hypothetical protein